MPAGNDGTHWPIWLYTTVIVVSASLATIPVTSAIVCLSATYPVITGDVTASKVVSPLLAIHSPYVTVPVTASTVAVRLNVTVSVASSAAVVPSAYVYVMVWVTDSFKSAVSTPAGYVGVGVSPGLTG